MDQTTVSETGEWARTIIEVYMLWFTFFLCSNMLALAWVCGRKIEDRARQMLTPICILFFVLNILGTISTVVVGRTVFGADWVGGVCEWAGAGGLRCCVAAVPQAVLAIAGVGRS